MGGAAGPDLVAAVVNAGALGVIPIWNLPVPVAGQWIEETKKLTDGAFGVNLRADLEQVDHLDLALDAGIPLIHLFWGDPVASMKHIDGAGVKVMVTVGDADAARIALDAGAHVLVAQGVEAGGHVLGELPLAELLDAVIPLAGNVPVIAAGGLATPQDVADVMQAGASGGLLGTRFVATRESMAHEAYKNALIEAGDDATVRSVCFGVGWEDAPHRTLRNTTVDIWEAAGGPGPGGRPAEDDIVMRLDDTPFPRYHAMTPMRGMSGDILAGAMYAGTGVGHVTDCPPAANVVTELASRLPED